MRIVLLLLTSLLYSGVFAQWVSVTPQSIKKLCRDKIRVFELEEISPEAKTLNNTIKTFFKKEWSVCDVEFIPHQINNPEYEKDGFHIVFYFQYNQKPTKKEPNAGDYSFLVNFNNCKPNEKEKEHYRNSLISYDLLSNIPGNVDDTATDARKALIDYTYNIGLKNKLELTLHCFQQLLADIMVERKTDLEVLANKNMLNADFPILVFNSEDLPEKLNEEEEFKKYTSKKVLVVEPQYFKNSKQGFARVGVVLFYAYRNPNKTDTISVYEINSGKLIGRFNTVLESEGNISKKEMETILQVLNTPSST